MIHSNHALIRTLERTKLRPEDVLYVIENKLYVKLGKHNDVLFVCFYSPFDDRCFIGLIGTERNCLITVLKLEHKLNPPLRQPTMRDCAIAKLILLTHKQTQIVVPTIDRPGKLVLTVEEGRVIHYEKIDQRDIKLGEVLKKEDAFNFLRSDIFAIRQIIDSELCWRANFIKYRIIFTFNPKERKRKVLKNFVYSHLSLKDD